MLHCQVNGKTLLILEYDAQRGVEVVCNGQREVLFTVKYDRSGRLIEAQPNTTALHGVNISYNILGRVTHWNRVDNNHTLVYDKKGRVVQHIHNNMTVFQYGYRTAYYRVSKFTWLLQQKLAISSILQSCQDYVCLTLSLPIDWLYSLFFLCRWHLDLP